MKDYYKILDVPESASQEEIRKSFRKLAFRHHPDTNPGNEKDSEEKFKEINEAFGVLGDPVKRSQYDAARKSPFAGAETGAFSYSQQDIFQGIFNNPAFFEELNRMFAQGGLRFDREFMNRVYFGGGRGMIFHFYGNRPGPEQEPIEEGANSVTPYRPGLLEKAAYKMVGGVLKLALKAFGVRLEPPAALDRQVNFNISESEAVAGGEIEFSYRNGRQTRKLLVKIPAGVKTGTRIRLRGVVSKDGRSGDLYLRVRVRK